MATHSGILPSCLQNHQILDIRTEELGRWHFIGSQRVRHNWGDLTGRQGSPSNSWNFRDRKEETTVFWKGDKWIINIWVPTTFVVLHQVIVFNPHSIFKVFFKNLISQIRGPDKWLKFRKCAKNYSATNRWKPGSSLGPFWFQTVWFLSLGVVMFLQFWGRKSRKFLTNVLIPLSNMEDEVPSL